MAPHRLCFEITETSAVSELAHALRFIETLKALGCQFALDDFGTGLSSFSYLKTLPVDYLKIDGGFVKGLVARRYRPGDGGGSPSYRPYHGPQDHRGVGGEPSDPVKLRQIGVDYGQGYALGYPRPLDLH